VGATGVVNDTTLLLDLDGVSVIRVELLEDGTRRVHLATAEEAARACPECGAFAWKVKGTARTCPRDLPYGERGLVLLWRKRRWWCREPKCPRKLVLQRHSVTSSAFEVADASSGLARSSP
jgi:transposase